MSEPPKEVQKVAGTEGVEPSLNGSEPSVMPLYQTPVKRGNHISDCPIAFRREVNWWSYGESHPDLKYAILVSYC